MRALRRIRMKRSQSEGVMLVGLMVVAALAVIGWALPLQSQVEPDTSAGCPAGQFQNSIAETNGTLIQTCSPIPACSNNYPQYIQCGKGSITIPGGTTQVLQTITYPTPFSTTPPMVQATINNVTGATSYVRQVYPFYMGATVPTLLYKPAFDTSAVVGDSTFATDPFSFSIAVTPSQPNETAVLLIGSAQTFFSGTFSGSVSSVADSQGSIWVKQFDTPSIVNDGNMAMWTTQLSTTAVDTITITYSNPGPDTMNAGAIVSLYQNIAGVLSSHVVFDHAQYVFSPNASLAMATDRENDIIVGGSVLNYQPAGVCGTLAPASGQMQRQNDDVNCNANLIMNYDLQDLQVLAPTPNASFNETASVQPFDGEIGAVVLEAKEIPDWRLSTTFSLPFNQNDNILGFQMPPSSIEGHFTCSIASTFNPTTTLTFQIIGNLPMPTVTSQLTGTVSSMCGVGRDVAMGSFPIAVNGNPPWFLQAKCAANCPPAGVTIEINTAYMLSTVIVNAIPGARIILISATSFRIVFSTNIAVSTNIIITFTWRATE